MPDQTWRNNLIRSTQNKRSSRSGTPLRAPRGEEVAYELVGVDGRYEGGAKVFPGFESILTIDPSTAWEGSLEGHVTSPGPPTSGYEISDFRPVRSFRIGDTSFGYGIVYRVADGNDSSGNAEHLFIQYRRNQETAWQVRHLAWHIEPGTLWDVVVFGALVYVFVEGRNPLLFYITEETPSTFDEVQIGGDNPTSAGTTTGPGAEPVLIGPGESTAQTLGELGDPASGSAHGQVVIPNNGGSPSVAVAPSAATETDDGWTKLFDDGAGAYDGPQSDDDVSLLDPGDYLVAFQLSDSMTGRRSQLSEIVELKETGFPDNGTAVGYVALEIVYDESKWDTARIYRSVGSDGGGGTRGSAFLQLDNVITLADHHISDQGTNDGGSGASGDITEPFGKAVYYFEASDKILASQEAYVDSQTFDDEMPYAGAALFYDNTMLVSRIKNNPADPDDLNSLGETRYSAISYVSPELFPPSSRFVPNLVTDAIERFVQVNDNVIGFTPNRLRFIRRDGASIVAPRDLHAGFGITGPRAVEVVGGQAYYITSQGLKTVNAQATLDSLQSADHVISEEWRGELTGLSMAYDSVLQALFLLNPTSEEALVFWFNKSRVTTLVDMTFQACERGAFPEDPSDTTTPLRERAMFLYANGDGSDGTYEIMIVDADKASGGSRNMLPISGDSILTLSGQPSGQPGRLQFAGLPTLSLTDDMTGRKLYVLQAADKSIIGESTTITGKAANDQLDTTSGAWQGNLVQGDKLGVSPVVFRWVSAPLPTFDRTGRPIQDMGLMRLGVDTIRPTFSGVAGDAAGTNWATFRGLVFRRDETTPLGEGVPLTSKGSARQGVNEGIAEVAAAVSPSSDLAEKKGVSGKRGVKGSALAVGVEIVCPDLDFVMVSARTEGTITREATDDRVREDDT